MELHKIDWESCMKWLEEKEECKRYPKEWLEEMCKRCDGNLFLLRQWCIEMASLVDIFGESFLKQSWNIASRRIMQTTRYMQIDDEQGILEDWDGSYVEFFKKMFDMEEKDRSLSQCVQWFESDTFFVPYGMFENVIRWLLSVNVEDEKEQWKNIYEIYKCFLQYFIYQRTQFEYNSTMDITYQYAYFTLYEPWRIISKCKKKWKVPQFSWMYNKTSYSLAYMKRRNEFQWTSKNVLKKSWESHCKTWISLSCRNEYDEKTKEQLTGWSYNMDRSYQWYNVFHLPIEDVWKDRLHPWCDPNILPWQYIPPKRKYEKKKKKVEELGEGGI
jgi:hypothetical protein